MRHRITLASGVLVALLILTGGTVNADPVTSGLVAHYELDGNAFDSSGSGFHGTLMGGTSFTDDRLGNPNSAGLFDGIDDWISSNQTFASDQSHSISAWVRWEGDTILNHQEIVSWWGSGVFPVAGRTFLGTAKIAPQGPMRYGDSWTDVPLTLPVGSWVHVAATYDGTTNDRQVFLNGALIGSKLATDEALFSLLAIGRQGNATNAGEYWFGAMDDVALYDRVLTLSEIEQNASSPVPEPSTLTLPALGLLALLKRRRQKQCHPVNV